MASSVPPLKRWMGMLPYTTRALGAPPPSQAKSNNPASIVPKAESGISGEIERLKKMRNAPNKSAIPLDPPITAGK